MTLIKKRKNMLLLCILCKIIKDGLLLCRESDSGDDKKAARKKNNPRVLAQQKASIKKIGRASCRERV